MVSGPEQLRDWMRRREVNQREAAELLNITEVFLSQLLNSKRTPGLENAIKIERLTGISVESWLLTAVSGASDESVTTPARPNKTKR